MVQRAWTGLFVLSALVLTANAQESGGSKAASQGSGQSEAKRAVDQPATESETAVKAPSTAERIARLSRAIEETDKQLGELRAKLDDPEGEYARAEAEFKKLDRDLKARERELQKLEEEPDSERRSSIEKEIENLSEQRRLAKDRFDLAIEERRTLQEQIGSLENKLLRDREAHNRLINPTASQPAPASAPAGAPPSGNGTTEPAATSAAAPPVESTAAGAPAAGAPPPAAPPAPESTGDERKGAAPSAKLIQAQEEAEKKETQAREAEAQVKSITERMDALRTSIDLERKQLETARKKVENARETETSLSEQADRRWNEGAPQAELRELWTKVSEARVRLREGREEVARHADRIDVLQGELSELQAEQIAALQEAQEQREAAEAAQQRVQQLESPFSPHNMLQWTLDHGPRLLGIIIGTFTLLWLARLVDRRMVRLIAGRSGPGSAEEKENRARTLVAVFHNLATVVICVGGALMLLAEVGMNIVPLMGGAAVFGLAFAFGAQNLIRDYFSGFMILMENQYGINDVVRVGDTAGLVERITLRITVLRDLEGAVHFIPNGQISQVTNLTHEWSRAVFDIGVSYDSDIDLVIGTVMALGRELREDPRFRFLIIDDLEMFGVDAFGDSAVMIKFVIKTRPMKQWTVKREMLRRIKKRFDELGIEIPFPHRTVYHRYVDGGGAESLSAAAGRRG